MDNLPERLFNSIQRPARRRERSQYALLLIPGVLLCLHVKALPLPPAQVRYVTEPVLQHGLGPYSTLRQLPITEPKASLHRDLGKTIRLLDLLNYLFDLIH